MSAPKKLHISRENLRRKILADEDLPVEVGALAKVYVALHGYGGADLARLASHFETGSREWAIIHNTDESIQLALEAVSSVLYPLQENEK